MFEKILNKLGYGKLPKPPKITKVEKTKGKWSKEALDRRKSKNYYKKNRLDIIRDEHQRKKMKVHFNDCPACNPNSPLTMDEYVKKTREACRHIAVAALQEKRNRVRTIPQDHSKDDDALIIEGMPAKDFDTHDRALPNLCTNVNCIHFGTWHPNQPCESAKGGFIL